MSARYPSASRLLTVLLLVFGLGAGAAALAVQPGTPASSSPTARPVVIDTDMSVDDWMAILLLLHRRDVTVKAITVSGNGVAHGAPGARNAIRLLDLEGRRGVPVAYGRATTYPGGHAFPEAWRPAIDAMLGIELPPPSRAVSRLSAAQLIADVAARSPVEILELGPPTNIADALRATPGLRKRVTSVTLMSGALKVAGSAPGNKAEWNFYVDPVAADIVLRSGIPWTLVPLDATNAAPYNEQLFRQLGARPKTAAARFVFEALSRQMPGEGLYFWDPFAAAVLVDPSVASLGRRTIRVVTRGAAAGRTVEARKGIGGQVALEGNQAQFEELFLAALNAPASAPPITAARSAAHGWTNTGPEGGWVLEVARHPKAGRVAYASSGYGLFRSTDGGASWTRRAGPCCLGDIAIDPQDPRTVYAVRAAEAYRSQDGGASWIRLPLGTASPLSVARVAVSTSMPETIYAVSSSWGRSDARLWSSADAGMTWVRAGRIESSRGHDPVALLVDPVQPTTVYVWVGAKGVFRSDDGGKTWTRAGARLPVRRLSSLEVDPATPCVLYAGTDRGDVFTSRDCGRKWTAAARGLDGAVGAIAVSTADGAVYAGTSPLRRSDGVELGGGVVYRSADGRAPWRRARRGVTGWYVRALAPDATTPNRVLAATEHGVFATRDGGATWTASVRGLVASNPAGLAVDPANPRLALVAVERGVAVSRDGGRRWHEALDVRGRHVRVGPLLAVPARPTTIYAVKGSQAPPRARWTLVVSRDAGRTWGTAGVLPVPMGVLVADPSRPTTLYGIRGYFGWPLGGIFKSVDGGRSWMLIYSAARKPPARALAVDPLHPNVLYAGLHARGWKYLRFPLLKSTDGGRTWRRLQGLGPGNVVALATDPRRSDTLYASRYGADRADVRVSRDGGRTWSELGRSPWDVGVLLVDPVRRDVVYAGTWEDIYVKTGASPRWRPIGATGGGVLWLAVDSKASRLYAGIAGGGVAATGLPVSVR